MLLSLLLLSAARFVFFSHRNSQPHRVSCDPIRVQVHGKKTELSVESSGEVYAKKYFKPYGAQRKKQKK
jgi:hypothetical protein